MSCNEFFMISITVSVSSTALALVTSLSGHDSCGEDGRMIKLTRKMLETCFELMACVTSFHYASFLLHEQCLLCHQALRPATGVRNRLIVMQLWLTIAMLRLQALLYNKMIAMMNTLPHANLPSLAPIGPRRLIARAPLALPPVFGLHSTICITGYMDKIPYDAF
jgi:hypothetical protein